jgi:TusA-related sulfurtransferase
MDGDVFKDLRGTVCPMNFVKVKVALSKMSVGQTLKVLLDDGEPIENVPRSVKVQGHEVVAVENEGDHWSAVIRKC